MNKIIITLVFLQFQHLVLHRARYKKQASMTNTIKIGHLKNNCGTYGFINRNNKLLFNLSMKKLKIFRKFWKICFSEKVKGSFGYIDRNGKEVIPTIHWTKIRCDLSNLKP